jgi:uncharacterized protein DUF2721
MANVAAAAEVLAAMITPALLISASGTLVLSTSHRLSRVVDRVRVLAQDAERLSSPGKTGHGDFAYSHAKRALIIGQLTALAQRAVILRSALAAFYMAIGFLVATSIGIGLLTLLHWSASWPAVALAMVGACALLWGSVLLVREGRLAIGSTLEEMQYIRGLVSGVPRAEQAKNLPADEKR